MARVLTVSLIVVLLLGVIAAAGWTAGSAQNTGPQATIQAQQTTIAELKGTVQARGNKINAQRTQIAEYRTQVAGLIPENTPTATHTPKPRVTSTPRPKATATPRVDSYLTNLRADSRSLKNSLDRFDREVTKFVNSGNGDANVMLREMDYWIELDGKYSRITPPSTYSSLHKDWVDILNGLRITKDTIDDAVAKGDSDDFVLGISFFYVSVGFHEEFERKLARY